MEGLLVERDCTGRCRSKQQAAQIIAAVVRGDFQQIRAYCWWSCAQFSHLSDVFGRTALHAAASCGQWKAVKWLLTKCGAEVDAKDAESGWTALHRALFHGHLIAAHRLLQHGASLKGIDHEGLTPLDLLVKDRAPHVEYRPSDPSEVYIWGANASFNLGQGNDLSKSTPELLDSFRRDNISIKQVVLCKFHSAFLSNDGRLLTCGHGHGGRLGQNSEQTSLTPAPVKGLGNSQCLQVAAGQDHLLLLTEGGQVFSCGLNTYHQLGHPHPPPERLLVPRPLSLKVLKGMDSVQGVAAAKYHSVIYTKDAVFTFGLNAGQLGHPQGERTQLLPRQVSALNQKDLVVTFVTASDAATICATSKGDVYVLHQYQCRRIASRQLDLKKVCAVGGHLDVRCDVAGLHEGGGSELKVLLLTHSGKLLLWREGCPVLRRCLTSQGPQPFVSDTCLNHFGLGLVTVEGGAFWGNFRQHTPQIPSQTPNHKDDTQKNLPVGLNWNQTNSLPASPTSPLPSGTSKNPVHSKSSRPLVVFLDRDECEIIKVKKITFAHRATGISCDPKGRNIALIQSHPKACVVDLPILSYVPMEKDLARLYREASSQDDVYDVPIRVGNRVFLCHRFILASRSEPLRKLLARQKRSREQLLIEGIEPDIMESMLEFIYTNSCDLLKEGKPVPPPKDNKNSKGPSGKKGRQHQNPEAEMLILKVKEASKRFGLKLLSEKLQDMHVVAGKLKSSNDSSLPRMEFDRQSFSEYWDVWLQSEEGVEFQCHKCLLVSRLEYFEHMLQVSVWREASNRSPIQLPMSARVLSLLVDYLYTNRGDKLYESEEVDFLCQCLAVSDQLLISRLKEMCEVALVDLVTLKNACELLELSHVYNAPQLKATCQQYILINLAAFLEAGSMDILSDEALESLTRAYRLSIPGMTRRVFTVNQSQSPSKEELQELCNVFQAPDPTQDLTPSVELSTKGTSRSAAKKRGTQRRISERSDDEKAVLETTPSAKTKSASSVKALPQLPTTPEKTPELQQIKSPVPKSAVFGRILKPWQPTEEPVSPPSRSEPEMGLKQIMQNEKEKFKDPSRPQLHSIQQLPTLKGGMKKLSQRERKALNLTASTDPVEIPSSIKTRSPSGSAWGQVSPPNAWNIPNLSCSSSPIASPPADVPKLEQILQEESRRITTTVQAKALHLINLEDKAMEELLNMYSSTSYPDERITVVRVPSAPSVSLAEHKCSLSKWSKRLI